MKEMQRARLIPVSGINGQAEAEQRATSALLAVISIVRDFSHELFGDLGASSAAKAQVSTFIEVEIKLATGEKVRADGLIRISYGKTEWVALVEVKTGNATLEADQLNKYLLAAREVGADCVVSISNEVGIAGDHPTEGLNVRSNSKIKAHHLSWSRLLATAVQCKVHAGVDDPEQSWILAELIRYLEHPASGVTEFDDMGQHWTEVRDEIRKGTMTRATDALDEIATKWDELNRHLTLRLSAQTGANVRHLLSRSEKDQKTRLRSLRTQLLDDGCLSSEIRVPNTASDVQITANLRTGQIATEANIQAPRNKGGRGSIGWLTRQLRDAPVDLSIEAFAKNARTPVIASLADAANDPNTLLAEGQNDISRFRLVSYREAGKSRRNGGRSVGFIDSVNNAFDEFYQLVVQQITPWTPTAPKVKQIEPQDSFPQPEPQRARRSTDRQPEGAPRSEETSSPRSTADRAVGGTLADHIEMLHSNSVASD